MKQQFINTGQDDRILENLFKYIQSMDVPDSEKGRLTEDLEKSINKAGLVQKEVQVTGKNGQIFMRKQWVKAGEEVKTLSTASNNSVKSEHLKREQLPATPHNITEKTKHLVPWNHDEELPEHIKELDKPIPPTWRNVMISPDPDADLLVIGKDDMNRTQYIYSKEFTERTKAEKFNRVKDIRSREQDIIDVISSLEDRDTADCLNLIYLMGIRPGSTADTKAATEATGASTLKGSHVVEEDGKVYLRFIGKKGVQQNHEVTDNGLKDILLERKKKSGSDGYLFDTTPTKLRKTLEPLGIHPKDLRTLLATKTAQEWLGDVEPTSDPKEFSKIRNLVGDHVCSILGNRREESLRSYIDPLVFRDWSSEGMKNWEDSQKFKKLRKEQENYEQAV